ncbi:DUF2637 domain-containing protein [Mycobacterium branderi]|uniref:DUF2637 domain-containing protein n=1 Tax=Mycobacterium branderi TaxID=43348 RepID=A0A7I7WBW1_9MYCO|nr:DUF2637 domain-containing protein [Mycobacterium branderi]MCV7236201.1 DUF2637 domain-containing protein [Mycobacterium branderi]ORA35389.1 hypothetical protein BST20_17445 [Mycobacterium branderi]BBZ15079.1 hypothetical protein MBRA_52740 [Mycobacterium branderi]
MLLASTHSVALLVKTRRAGVIYWCALAMTIALTGCAFVLSFDALRDLAVALGMLPDRAWLGPVAIDVSIANATLGLLSLTPPRKASVDARRAKPAGRQRSGAGGDRRSTMSKDADAAPSAGPQSRSAGREVARTEQPASSKPAERLLAPVPDTAGDSVDSAAVVRWRPAADELVRSGVTSKDPAIVAAVLAAHAAGTPPSTIGRRLEVHHSTVGRILTAARRLTG